MSGSSAGDKVRETSAEQITKLLTPSVKDYFRAMDVKKDGLIAEMEFLKLLKSFNIVLFKRVRRGKY